MLILIEKKINCLIKKLVKNFTQILNLALSFTPFFNIDFGAFNPMVVEKFLSLKSFLNISPEYFLATSILGVALYFSILPLPRAQKNKINSFSLINSRLNFIFVLIIFLYVYLLTKQSFFLFSESLIFQNSIFNDFTNWSAKLIVGFTSLIYLLTINAYLIDQRLNRSEYYILVLTAILGFSFLCSSSELMTVYIALELQGLAFYVMASFQKSSSHSVESGLKYFIIGSFSTTLFLFGSNFFYGVCGTFSIFDYKNFFIWSFSINSFFILFKDFYKSFNSFRLLDSFSTVKNFQEFPWYFSDLESVRDNVAVFKSKTIFPHKVLDIFTSENLHADWYSPKDFIEGLTGKTHLIYEKTLIETICAKMNFSLTLFGFDKSELFLNQNIHFPTFFFKEVNKLEIFLENSVIINLIEEESLFKTKNFLSDLDGKNIAEKDFDLENFYLKKFSKYTMKFNEFVVPSRINTTQFDLSELDCKSFFSNYLTDHKQDAFIYNCSELLNLFFESKNLSNLQFSSIAEQQKNEKMISYDSNEWKKMTHNIKTLEFAIGLTEMISMVSKNLLETNNTSLIEADLTTRKLELDIEKLRESDTFEFDFIFSSKKINDFLLNADSMIKRPFPVSIVAEELVKDFCWTGLVDRVKILEYFPKFLELPSEKSLTLNQNFLNVSIIPLMILIFLTSLFLKLGLTPFHLWSPDVYEGSPSSTTFFFLVVSKIVIFVFLVRICYLGFYSFINIWQFYALIVAILSVLVGSIAALKQRRMKSMLAYSSISNMGLILLAFSLGTFEGVKMVFYFFIVYTLSGLSVWSIFLMLKLKNSTEKYNKELGDFTLLNESHPVLAYAFVLTVFTLAGIPPMAGFLAKLNIFLTLILSSFYYSAFIVILSSVIATFYYIRLLKISHFEEVLVGRLFFVHKSWSDVIKVILFFSILFFFISPSVVYFFSHKMILFLSKTFY